MDELIIKDTDLTNPDHWPVEVVFGLYEDTAPGFLNVLASLSKGVGYGFNDAGVTFWGDLDDYEKASESPFEVECFVLDDICQLTYAEFDIYVNLACERYVMRFPEEKGKVESLADAYRQRFLS